MRRIALGAVAIIVMTLVAASLQDHVSSGGINMGLSSAASSGIPSEQIAPAQSSPHPVFLGAFSDAADAAAAGTATGAGVSAVLGPEAVPEGAAIGGAFGAIFLGRRIICLGGDDIHLLPAQAVHVSRAQEICISFRHQCWHVLRGMDWIWWFCRYKL